MDENLNQEATPVTDIPEEDAPSSSFPIKKIVSLGIGVFVLILILVLVFVVVIPKIFKGKPANASITYWGLWEDSTPIQQMATDFMRQNPTIQVKIEKQDVKSLDKYTTRLTTRIDNGSGPDVFRFHNSWMFELQSHLLPLPQDVVSSTGLDSNYYPVVSQDLKINGAYYGIPIHFDTLALFINTDLFKNAGIASYPSSWDDLISVAKQLTVKDNTTGKITTSGIALGTYDNIAHAPDIISLLLVQNGANILDLGGPNKQNAIDGLNFYASFAKGPANVWDSSMDNSKLAFAKGNVAMYIGYSWDIFDLKALNPNLQYTIVPVPHLLERKNTIASYWVEGVSAKTKYPKQSFEFLKYLASKENMQKMYANEAKIRAFGELFPRSDMADSLKSNALIYPFVAQGKDAVSTIFSSDTYDNGDVDALNVYLGNAVRAVVNDNSSADSAIGTLSDGVKQILSRNGR